MKIIYTKQGVSLAGEFRPASIMEAKAFLKVIGSKVKSSKEFELDISHSVMMNSCFIMCLSLIMYKNPDVLFTVIIKKDKWNHESALRNFKTAGKKVTGRFV